MLAGVSPRALAASASLRMGTSVSSKIRRGSGEPGKERTRGMVLRCSRILTYSGGYMWVWMSTTLPSPKPMVNGSWVVMVRGEGLGLGEGIVKLGDGEASAMVKYGCGVAE